jgi:chemotaxis protein methyltransferase WspC
MTLKDIELLVLERFGLSVASLGPNTLSRAVKRRLAALGSAPDAFEPYLQLLQHAAVERQELLELLVVPETWFFRDDHVWPWLARYAIGSWMPKHHDGPLRVLSLACATGEEPYSVSMALQDAGFPRSRLSIEAVDISLRSLERAGQGTYGRNSFRNPGVLPSVAHHFDALERGFYRLRKEARLPVRFAQANLHDPGFVERLQHRRYDIIFCRNVMIYFPKEGQKRLLGAILQLLEEDGLFFAGHSELVQFIDERFHSTGVPMTFSFRRRRPNDRQMVIPATPTAAAPPEPVAWRPLRAPAPAAVRAEPQPAAAAPAGTAPQERPTLAAARAAADAGDLDRAERICEELAVALAQNAEHFVLRGVISEARGDSDQAEQHLRRALYLEPRNEEALLHLALLLERRQDPAHARIRSRLARSRSRSRDTGGGTAADQPVMKGIRR